MRSVGFFCAVFFSMLAVFLLATGEFKRWFFAGEDPYRWTVQLAPAPAEEGEKTVKFDAYNVELGRRSLSIRAEFDEVTAGHTYEPYIPDGPPPSQGRP